MSDATRSVVGPVPQVPREMTEPETGHSLDPQQVMATRELFWQNVIREILTSLSMVCALRPSPASAAATLPASAPESGDAEEENGEPGEDDEESQSAAGEGEVTVAEGAPDAADATTFDSELFDGRLAVITRRGDRIPIADVFPLFACGIATPRDRVLSIALECTVFQIRTPAGEVYTLPLHDIATFQALSPELMRRLSNMARKQQEQETGENGLQQPFGFAAFTSVARETPPPMTEQAGSP
jgi:ribosomal protein L12E/L44/L45/RPP1/RPP2